MQKNLLIEHEYYQTDDSEVIVEKHYVLPDAADAAYHCAFVDPEYGSELLRELQYYATKGIIK